MTEAEKMLHLIRYRLDQAQEAIDSADLSANDPELGAAGRSRSRGPDG
jgi:hypothetical protein